MSGTLSGTQKVTLSIALLLLAAAMAGIGAYAPFTDSASASNSVTTGTVGSISARPDHRRTDSTSMRPPSRPATRCNGVST